MFTNTRSARFALAVTLLLSLPVAEAARISISGTGVADGDWEVTLMPISSAVLPTLKRQIWWGNPALAARFAQETKYLHNLPNPGDGVGTGPGFAYTVSTSGRCNPQQYRCVMGKYISDSANSEGVPTLAEPDFAEYLYDRSPGLRTFKFAIAERVEGTEPERPTVQITLTGSGEANGTWEVSLLPTTSYILPTLQNQVWWGDRSLAKRFATATAFSLGLPNPGDGVGRGPGFALRTSNEGACNVVQQPCVAGLYSTDSANSEGVPYLDEWDFHQTLRDRPPEQRTFQFAVAKRVSTGSIPLPPTPLPPQILPSGGGR